MSHWRDEYKRRRRWRLLGGTVLGSTVLWYVVALVGDVAVKGLLAWLGFLALVGLVNVVTLTCFVLDRELNQ